MWRHQATPTYSVQRYAACREVVSDGQHRKVFLGKNCSPCVRATGQGNHFEFIPTVSVESQHSTGGPTCHDFPRFVIVSEKSIPEVRNRWLWSSQNGGFFGKKDHLRANFHKCFRNPHRAHGNTSFCANFVKFGRPEVGEIARYLMDQKNKISARPPAAASARIAPKICQWQLQTIDSEIPKCHPNPFTLAEL